MTEICPPNSEYLIPFKTTVKHKVNKWLDKIFPCYYKLYQDFAVDGNDVNNGLNVI
jgi:hypothetical protein